MEPAKKRPYYYHMIADVYEHSHAALFLWLLACSRLQTALLSPGMPHARANQGKLQFPIVYLCFGLDSTFAIASLVAFYSVDPESQLPSGCCRGLHSVETLTTTGAIGPLCTAASFTAGFRSLDSAIGMYAGVFLYSHWLLAYHFGSLYL